MLECTLPSILIDFVTDFIFECILWIQSDTTSRQKWVLAFVIFLVGWYVCYKLSVFEYILKPKA